MLLLVIFGLLIFVIFAYFLIPLILEQFPSVTLYLIFKANAQEHFDIQTFTHFCEVDLNPSAARNFYLRSIDLRAQLGVWHIKPFENNQTHENGFPGAPVIIYFHGQSKSRATPWRVQVYKLFSSMGYHVITFDYRGFADSIGVVTKEMDCVLDSLAVLHYVYSNFPTSPVIMWGHSLGTGVVSATLSLIRRLDPTIMPSIRLPDGVVLEAPFTNITQAAMCRGILRFYSWLPNCQKRIRSATNKLDIVFDNESYMKGCRVPLMILHAEDDHSVPHKLGFQLAETLKATGNDQVIFKGFPRHLGLRHNFIHTAPELPVIIRDFIQHCRYTAYNASREKD